MSGSPAHSKQLLAQASQAWVWSFANFSDGQFCKQVFPSLKKPGTQVKQLEVVVEQVRHGL